MIERPLYSYRDDATVPAFDDSRPVFIFDGTCVLCSRGASWLMRVDRQGRVRLLSAQSPLGRALYAHYGMALDDSYVLLDRGRAWIKSDGYIHVSAILGGAWRLFGVAAITPRGVRDAVYDWVARNRYRWFGRAQQCALLTPAQRARLLQADG